MAIISQTQPEKHQIDLSGPQGNAMCLIGGAKTFARQLNWTFEKKKKILDEMMRGDYINLLLVFDHHFGKFIDLAASDELQNKISARLAGDPRSCNPESINPTKGGDA